MMPADGRWDLTWRLKVKNAWTYSSIPVCLQGA